VHSSRATVYEACRNKAGAQEITLPFFGVSSDLSIKSIFIGTAAVLIRAAGLAILTDPNSIYMHEYMHEQEQVDLDYGLSITRQTKPTNEGRWGKVHDDFEGEKAARSLMDDSAGGNCLGGIWDTTTQLGGGLR